MEDYLNLAFRTVLKSQSGSDYTCLQRLGAGGSAETYLTIATYRDIKPANVFIKGGSCVLGDFGLLKRTKIDPGIDRQMLKESLGPGMPRNYRTPDLIDYLKGGSPPTEKSDIYQLGLVFAEMFSGTNPQRPMKTNDFAEPIELDSFDVLGGLGTLIKGLIEPMLGKDPARRPSAAELLPRWQDVYLIAADRAHALDGRVV